jgi:hypothetical protein
MGTGYNGATWNPISFNQAFDPTDEVQFVTAGGGFRHLGWLVGAKAYYDINNRQSPETMWSRCGIRANAGRRVVLSPLSRPAHKFAPV